MAPISLFTYRYTLDTFIEQSTHVHQCCSPWPKTYFLIYVDLFSLHKPDVYVYGPGAGQSTNLLTHIFHRCLHNITSIIT